MPDDRELGPELEIVDPDAPEEQAERDTPAEEAPTKSADAGEAAPDLDVEETPETKKAFEKQKADDAGKPQGGASQLVMILAVFAVLFVMLNPALRGLMGGAVGFVMEPTVVALLGQWPVLVLLLVGMLMVGLSTVVRHFFIDWMEMARINQTMRAFQKEFREARVAKDNARIQKLQKMQPEVMKLQTKISSSQMKPMVATMVVVIPLFAWLWNWISELHYPYFTTPWNTHVYMYGATILPHWILLYSLLTIPFGQLVQKGLKVWSWRHRIREIHARAEA